MLNPNDIVAHAKRIIIESRRTEVGAGALAEARELTRIYGGKESSFYKSLMLLNQASDAGYLAELITSTLEAFVRFVEGGLAGGVSLQRRAQIDVVSDVLDQANRLLSDPAVHPAAAAVLVGAALEEFLRNWVEEKGLSLGNRKPGIEAYSGVLREADLIEKQDTKDITAWGGVRNSAAHGKWDEVSDRARVQIMLEGVNLFMRRHGGG